MNHIPELKANAFRLALTISVKGTRLDGELMKALRSQSENLDLKNISRDQFKKLFQAKKILIKGQPAKPASALAAGVTYVDVLLS